MPFKSVITNNAKADIQQAIDWYNNQQEELGKRFINSVDEKINKLCITPGIGSIRYDKVRWTITQVFPYIIHYIIDMQAEQIIILRVLHAFRKPIY